MELKEGRESIPAGGIYRELAEVEDRLKEFTASVNDSRLNEILTEAQKKLNTARLHLVEAAVRTALKDTSLSDSLIENGQDKKPFPDKISLKQALWLTEQIKEEAERLGMAVVIAIADKAARPITVQSMEEAYIASFDIALNKAFTSAALKMSTSELKNLSQPGKELYGIQNTNEGKIVIFGGGEPLIYKDTLLGGLGVSGGTESQDAALAAYGKEKLKEAFSWI